MAETPSSEYVDGERPAGIEADVDPEAPADAPEERTEPPGQGRDSERDELGLTSPDDDLADENAATSLDQPSDDVR